MKCFLCDLSLEEKSLAGIVHFHKFVCEDCVRLANAAFARTAKVDYVDFVPQQKKAAL
jgi:hypothetical protein